ncbi:MAG: TonB-dependent receptor [Candidatus Eisenbacteria bacterium]
MIHRIGMMVAALGLVAGALSARAQLTLEDFDNLDLGEILDTEVVSASKRLERSSEAPATVHVVSRAQIDARGYRNLEDLLEDIPGVEIQKNSVSEQRNQISMRGIAGNEKFIVLLDGHRINSTTGTPHVVGANFSLANAERVEVVLGPASALYGVDAFAGIVSIYTRSGAGIDGGEVTGSAGSFLTSDDSIVYGKQISEHLDIAVTVDMYHSDEPVLPDYYRDDFAWYRDVYSKTGLVQKSPFEKDELVATGTPVEYEAPTDAHFVHARLRSENFEIGYTRNREAHSSSIGMRPEYNVYGKGIRFDIGLETIYADHEYAPNGSRWSIEGSISKSTYRLDPSTVFVNTFSSYERAYKYESGTSTTVEEQLRLDVTESTSAMVGVSYQDLTAIPKTGDLPFPYDEGVAPDAQDEYYLGTDILDGDGDPLTVYQDFFFVQYQNYGVFAQVQSDVGRSLILTAGARHDHNTRYGSSFNPRVGVVFSPTPKVKTKLLYGQAFLAPSPYKAYQHYGSFVPVEDPDTGEVDDLLGTFWHLPNPDLEPEYLRSFEAGLSLFVVDGMVIQAAAVHTIIDDLIVNDISFDQEFKGIPVSVVERAFNKGRAEIDGATASVMGRFRLGSWRLSPFSSYAWADGNVAGARLPYTAKHTLKAGLEARRGRFTVTPRFLARSKTYQSTDAGEEASNEGFAVVNLFARIEDLIVTPTWDVAAFLDVRNLTNRQYYNVSQAAGEGFVATPQDPIRLLVGTTVTF